MDSNEKQFDEYYEQMPWAAVPFTDAATRQQLAQQLQVFGIPALAMLGPGGALIARNAVGAARADPAGQRVPWAGAASAGSR